MFYVSKTVISILVSVTSQQLHKNAIECTELDTDLVSCYIMK